MWLLALIPIYLAVAFAVARFCQLNSRLDETMSDYFSMVQAERRAELALESARQELSRSRTIIAGAKSEEVLETIGSRS